MMKLWEKEKGYKCPICGKQSLYRLINPPEEDLNYYCFRCMQGFMIIEHGALSDSERKEIEQYALSLKCNQQRNI